MTLLYILFKFLNKISLYIKNMGGIITKDNSMNKIILYRADHHNSGKFMTFFSKLSGLICSLNASEHHNDENLNLYVYECDINLREIGQNVLVSNMPPIINKYNDRQYEFCATIYNPENRNAEFGDFFVANYNKIKNMCKLKKTYNINFLKLKNILEKDKEYQTELKNVKNIDDNKRVFEKLISESIAKKLPNVDGKSKKKSKRRSRRKKSN